MRTPSAFRRSIAITPIALAFVWSTLTLAASDVPAATTDAATLSKARATGNKKRAERKFYEPQFDLSGLPEYKPQQIVSGTIRFRSRGRHNGEGFDRSRRECRAD